MIEATDALGRFTIATGAGRVLSANWILLYKTTRYILFFQYADKKYTKGVGRFKTPGREGARPVVMVVMMGNRDRWRENTKKSIKNEYRCRVGFHPPADSKGIDMAPEV